VPSHLRTPFARGTPLSNPKSRTGAAKRPYVRAVSGVRKGRRAGTASWGTDQFPPARPVAVLPESGTAKYRLVQGIR